jgi:fructoselysine 6-kinase
MPGIIGVGDNVMDRYLDLNRMFPGGNTLNVAVLARRSGADAAYIGCLGNDFAGGYILDILKKERVDVPHVKVMEGSNAYSRVTLVNGDRTFLGGHRGVSLNIELRNEHYDYIKGFDIIHTSIFSGIEKYLKNFTEIGIPVAFDYSNVFSKGYIERTLPYVTYAFFSGSSKTVDEIKEFQFYASSFGPKYVLVTRGAEGAMLYAEGKYYEQEIIPVELVDTLGAGDGFIARFLTGVLKKEAIEETLLEAAKVSAKVCTHYGAFGNGVEMK